MGLHLGCRVAKSHNGQPRALPGYAFCGNQRRRSQPPAIGEQKHIARDDLGSGATGASILFAITSAGMLTMSVAIAVRRHVPHKGAVLLIYAITIVLALLSLILAGGSGPLYAFMAVVIFSGIVLLLLTFRSGRADALEASAYDPEARPPDDPHRSRP